MEHSRRWGGKYCNFLYVFAIVLSIIIFVTSIYHKHELYSVAVWYIPVIFLLLSAIWCNVENSNFLKLVFENRALYFIGTISFEFFMIHQLIIRYVDVLVRKCGIVYHDWYCMLILLCTILLSWGLYSVIMKWRN